MTGLALDGKAGTRGTATASAAATLTTAAAGDVIIVLATVNTSTATVSTVTATGLTFNLRTAVNVSGQLDFEEWWAPAATTISESITVSWTSSGGVSFEAYGVKGSPNYTSPWDSNASIPATAQLAAGSKVPSVTGVSTTSSLDFICEGMGCIGSPTVTIPGSATLIATVHVGPIDLATVGGYRGRSLGPSYRHRFRDCHRGLGRGLLGS
jgi:hypothetical protein